MPLLGLLLPKLFDLFAGAFKIDVTSDDTKLKLAQLNLEATKLGNELLLAQTATNTAEANAPNRKWITWRELLGYAVVLGFIADFVLPHIVTVFSHVVGHPVVLPATPTAELMTIIMGMLGLAGGAHFVDSKYNSPVGLPPSSGSIVGGVWQPK